ncbi:hypothetical protein [Jeotgalibacillus soli]|uniref:Squalene cyclase C-terminal domain-containing protein n=1 Tax=Jeotgalibacillus soli TaxID=889306 RepID=A0A0C2S6P2_9BACL|nr:hypothetical protein [Jeotgalibacillus soli]KIL49704.1 hypothetical protein KP78_11720 [Jeotgalibacillus soli]
MNLLMKYLSKEQIEAIDHYIMHEARPVDRAFYLYRQGKGSAEDVIQALQSYQNQDGGFGHALEPDSRLTESSVLNTTIAFQFLSRLPVNGDHQMVQKGLNYLIQQYNATHGTWPIVPAAINQVPRAPWWNVNEETGETSFEKTPGNPAAEILGYFQHYRKYIPLRILEQIQSSVMKRWDEIDEWEMHEVQCYYRLAELTNNEEIRARIIRKMRQNVNEIFLLTKKQWAGYGLQPMVIVKEENSPLYSVLEGVVEENHQWFSSQLEKAGYWKPGWEWGQYPKEWEQAKKEWCSYITVMACF